jgi:CRP-like cAMP-binding protein
MLTITFFTRLDWTITAGQVNIVVAAWIIGSITLLIVKGDEKTGQYRDSLSTLHQYGQMHQFDDEFQEKLKSQLRLGFHNREIADESVLKNFPSAIRRKILRRLYLQPLVKTQLMEGVRPQFVDAFLSSCTVEIFSPGEEIVERGAILSDLFLLVGGVAEITTPTSTVIPSPDEDDDEKHLNNRKLEAGDFIGEIGFFTESPQVDRVSSLTACKTLTISQSAYKLLAQDHPGSVGKILQNLLVKVENMKRELPKKLSVLRAGSVFDAEAGYGAVEIDAQEEEAERKQGELTAIKDLVEMHMSKQLDDQTTRLLFAASRGDTSTISLMCENGFIPDNCDYDNRSAMMVAAMKGNTDVVKLLLEYKANPNLTDMHGSTALLEAVKNGHEATMKLLMEHGAKLCMPESLAASVLCQAVFDGDILLLRRLLMAGIEINAADYDKRTAAHIAAAEGNIAAIRVLADNGADLTLEDRWKNTVQHEAERSNTRQLLEYLKHKQT